MTRITSPTSLTSFACAFVDGLGAATVNVTADDHAADNNIGDDPHVVTINNVAPVASPPAVDAPENQNATEGSAHAFAIGSFIDAGSNDGPWAVEIDWGDGTPHDTFNQATQGSLGTASHGFADDGVYVVTIYVTDKDTATGHAKLSVTVNNVAPTIAISGAASVNEGSAYSLTLGAVTDPGTDTVSSYIVHWGDGSSATPTRPPAPRPTPTPTAPTATTSPSTWSTRTAPSSTAPTR